MEYLLQIWKYRTFFCLFYTSPNSHFFFSYSLSFWLLSRFFENVSINALVDSWVHICAYDFISRLWPTASHLMPSHFLDRGFLGRWALYCTYIVPWPANSTRTSMIYKFIAALPHHTLFHDTQFANESSETCNLTSGSSHLLGNYFHPILKPMCPISIFGHFLESLSRLQFHTYPNFLLVHSWTSGVHFQCSLTCKQLPGFCDIQIEF